MVEPKKASFSASLVSQGTHRFYTLTMPSDVLAKTCFVSTRDGDPKVGFQRLLDKRRALEIAEYIDKGLGTIPTSVVLSAQETSEFEYVSKTKTVEFFARPKSFLILDGQHRVYGFSLTNAQLRVPVVIYNGLSRRDETRLFIDINNKQRPVSNELLLEIKGLAEYDSDEEQRLRKMFDALNSTAGGPLQGLLSPTAKTKGKISRVTFNAAVKPLLNVLSTVNDNEVHAIISNYISALNEVLGDVGFTDAVTRNAVVFKSFMRLFPDVARKVKDRHGPEYSHMHFVEAVQPLAGRIGASKLKNPGTSVQALGDELKKVMDSGFQL
jgi:DGQHR domain-containing protein